LQSTHGFTAAVSVLSQEAFRWLVVWAYVKCVARACARERARRHATLLSSLPLLPS